jgi:hypothetical protein
MPLSVIWDFVLFHFFRRESLERVAMMRRSNMRKEEWFQTELMWLIDQLKERHLVTSWEPEYYGSVDFPKIEVAGASAAIEVKTVNCGRDKNQSYPPCHYGKDECSKGVRKLEGTQPLRYLLVFGWRNALENDPALTDNDWKEMLDAVRSETKKAGISFVRKPESSSDGGLSIGIFQVP